MSNLTQKEMSLLSDLLTYEEAACKKAKMYANTLTDKNLSDALCELSQNHARRYAKLLELL